MKYTIYMLKDEHHSNLFMNYKWNMEHDGVSLDQYEPVYSGEITSGDSAHDIGGALERIFNLLNSNRPEDYNCRSLSVSDVVHLENFGYWYCDTIGFKKMEDEPQKVWLVMGGGYFGTPTVRSVWSSEEKANTEIERLKLVYADQPLCFSIKEMKVE